MFEKIHTTIPGVLILQPRLYRDSRGFFAETYHAEKFAALGIGTKFVQDNHSCSVRDTLRGLHYQLRHPQAKLCRVIRGEVFDVAVDIRRGSPTFGKWVGVLLTAEAMNQIFIPPGFAHGFAVRSESAEFLYKCSDFYDSSDEAGIAWNDPQLGIDWQISSPLLSVKDSKFPRLEALPEQNLPTYVP